MCLKSEQLYFHHLLTYSALALQTPILLLLRFRKWKLSHFFQTKNVEVLCFSNCRSYQCSPIFISFDFIVNFESGAFEIGAGQGYFLAEARCNASPPPPSATHNFRCPEKYVTLILLSWHFYTITYMCSQTSLTLKKLKCFLSDQTTFSLLWEVK